MKQLMGRGEKKPNLTLTYKNIPCLDLLAAAPFCQMGEGASARGQPLQLSLSHPEGGCQLLLMEDLPKDG